MPSHSHNGTDPGREASSQTIFRPFRATVNRGSVYSRARKWGKFVLTAQSTIYRFGEFSLDADSGEQRRNGTVARLQPQPLQVLLAMLRRRGQIVAREELQASLWPENTNVELDDGPNHAIRRLRSALGDTAPGALLHRDDTPARIPVHRQS